MGKYSGFVLVEADTLDNIVKEQQINEVNFIKMDVEGAAIEALKGMEDTLRNNDVKLAIAAYHKEEPPTYKAISSFLREHGFDAAAQPFVYARKVKGMGK